MCTTKEAADQAGSHKWRELGLFRGKVSDFSKLSKCPDCPKRKMLKISELQWSSIAKAPDRAFENFIEIIKKKEKNLKETLRPCGARKQVLSHQRKGGGDQMTIQDFLLPWK